MSQASSASPLIRVPFPPVISVSDIVNKRNPSRIKSKSPNAFLIYRKAFLDQLSNLHYNLKMTDVSKLVSSSWKSEPESVKDAYRKIAQEVEVELGEKRKASTTYRIVWKNSKYSSCKRNKIVKTTEVNVSARFVHYQLVPAFPESSDREVIPTSDSEN